MLPWKSTLPFDTLCSWRATASLFTGDAGSGESNIRRHIIENDLLDTIIQLPNTRTGAKDIDRLRALHLMQPEKARHILADHRQIAQGLADRNPATAGSAMRQHLSQSILFAERLTARNPEIFQDRGRS